MPCSFPARSCSTSPRSPCRSPGNISTKTAGSWTKGLESRFAPSSRASQPPRERSKAPKRHSGGVNTEHGIEAEGLVRTFKGGIRAVDGINLAVAPGEIYGFLGPNGAGKSTTVHILTTLLPPTAGSARVGGFDVVHQGPKVRTVIGAALQEAALDPLLTGREHLRLQAALQALPREGRIARADALLDRVGLAQAADRK